MSQTWTTKDRQKIPVTQMTDEHLANSIALLRKMAKLSVKDELKAAIWATEFLQGEQAVYQAEQSCVQLYGILNDEDEYHDIDSVAEEMFPKFKMLIEEFERRELVAIGLI